MAYVESVLKRCSSFPHLQQLHAHLLVTGLFHFYSPRSKFLDFCATSSASGSLPYAAAVFRFVPFPYTNDWNALIRGHAQSHHPINAVTCYLSMLRAPCKPDALTCSFFLKACARALAAIESLQMHAQVLKSGFDADVLLQTTLLDAYAKIGDLDNACKVFEEMSKKKDIASWNALISGLAQGNRPHDALKLFDKMTERNDDGRGIMVPNEITVLGALSACAQLGAIKEADKVYDYVRERRLDEDVIVCNAVIDMYAKCGMVEKAYYVFEGMRCVRSIITWNSMIMGFAMDGNGAKALELFNRFARGDEEGLKPDSVTYLGALCACNHTGMVDEGVRLFELMDIHKVSKNMKHYGSVVDLLGRAGRLDEAYKIVESMPMAPDAVLWQMLLSSSKTYANVEMAEMASRKLAEMGSHACGDFVLLSNIYAAHNRWNDVGRVRDAMTSREVKKVPGFSYVEKNGVTFQFFNGDKSHPNWRDIYAKLEEITFRIREFGYKAETNYVLHDIGQEEKENALAYHSEKLALAFGLISTDDGSPININKNLRICGDCHLVMKLASKLYDREIIVRDRTRFHRFKQGSCSCGDFW